MYIDFNIENQKMRRCDNNILAANSQNLIKARFTFDESWSALNKKAVFECNDNAYKAALSNNECSVPAEVLKEGHFTVGVMATDNNESSMLRATSNTVSIEVKKGPSVTAENAPEPLPLEIERIEAIAQSVRDDADNGLFTATVTVGQVTSLDSSEKPKVTNVGTASNAILNFGIPKGKDGASILNVSTKDELDTAIRTLILPGDSTTVYIIWRGADTDIRVSGAGIKTLIKNSYYTVSCTRSISAYITYTNIEKTGSAGEEYWEMLYDSVLSASSSSIAQSVSTGKEYNALSILLYIPSSSENADIELLVDSLSIGKVTNAISSEKASVILIDAYKKYMWNTDFTVWHTDAFDSAEALFNSELSMNSEQYHVKSFYRGSAAEYLNNTVAVSCSCEMPADTVMKIMAKRV